jgi:predicted phage terminase large subunit-like protein
MQRLHAEDISGVILSKKMNYVHLLLPAEFDPERKCRTPIFEDPRTHAGEAMDPVRMPKEELETLKRDMGSYAYEGQYNQQPGSREGVMFKRSWFSVVKAAPAYANRKVRSWDLAATIPEIGKDPDWTVGLKMSTDGRRWYIEHVERLRERGDSIRRAIKNCAMLDGHACHVRLPKDPGQAGKDQAESLVAMLAGWKAQAIPETGDKQTRAVPFAAQCEAGNVVLVEGPWNEAFLDVLCGFPGGKFDDDVDSASGAFNYLATMPKSADVTDDMIDRARRGG